MREPEPTAADRAVAEEILSQCGVSCGCDECVARIAALIARHTAAIRAEMQADYHARIEAAFREGWSVSPFMPQSQNQAWWSSRAWIEIQQERGENKGAIE